MSFFAGIVSFDDRMPLPQTLCEKLIAALSRHPEDRPRVLQAPGCLLVQVVLPSETEACDYRDESGRVTLLAGSPLFGQSVTSADDAVGRLHAALSAADSAPLIGARGSFCAVQWSPASQCLTLVADKLGLRPIYFGIEQGVLVFSTALRVLEAVGNLTRSIDLRGVAEIASFGYPLGSRSPYGAVRTIEAGEVVNCTAGGVQSHHYWRWDRLPGKPLEPEKLPQAVFEAFLDAIDCRLNGSRHAVAGLSGGLDSRCVVAGLRSKGVQVDSINFAPAGSEDLVLGRLTAQAMGTAHFEASSGPLEFWDRMQAAHQAWLQDAPTAARVEQPFRLWSGDGGSCGLGHIYLTEEIVQRMGCGNIHGAIDAYLDYNRIGLPRRLLVHRERERFLSYLRSGLREELGRLESADAGRRMHLFLMVNGQRRLLGKHYENIDLRRFELITPFFDSELLRLVLASPIEGFLRHRFYSRWLDEFPPEVRQTAWQTYPGHEPCPVDKPTGLRSQWDGWYDTQTDAEIRRRDLVLANRLQTDPHFPRHLLNHRVLWLARRLTALRFGNYAHVIKCAEVFTRYCRALDGSS